ncbi:MAG: AN1-type zinc finger protein [Candidatus Hodarchaeales archaeon]
MSSLTDRQQKTLLSGILIIVLVISLDLLLPNNDLKGKILLWSIASIFFAVITIYYFVLNSSSSRGSFSRFSQFSGRNDGFKPRITPPSVIKEKKQFRGNCDYCSESTSLGFNCSYCDGFYCSNHRLPEKHHCSGIQYR